MIQNHEIPTYDTVVVGGGIAGMYCSLKLARKNQRVALFEKSNRWGGRIETVRMGKGKEFKAEFGAMRYEEKGQKLLRNLLDELKLKYSPFPPYQSAKPKWPDYHIQDPEEKRWQEDPLNLLRMGILKVLGMYRNGMSKMEMDDEIAKFEQQEPASAPEYDFDNLRKTARQGGKPNGALLYTLGFWNALSDALSHRAVLKIRDMGNFYHLISENPNAIEWIIFWLRGLQPRDRLVGIKGGSAQITNKILEKLDAFNNFSRKSNQELRGMSSEGELIRLYFRGDIEEVLAKHVILALPKESLIRLSPYFPKPIREALDGVIPIPLLKLFFVTDAPWWDEDTQPQTGAYTMPTREIHYYQEHSLQLSQDRQQQYETELDKGLVSPDIRNEFLDAGIELPDDITVEKKKNDTGWVIYYTYYRKSHEYFVRKEDLSVFNKNGKGMVMIYTESAASEYWSNYILAPNDHEQAEIRGDLRLVKYFFKYLTNDFEMEQQETETSDTSIPANCWQHVQNKSAANLVEELKGTIEDFGIHDWGKEPYGAACHVWQPNAKSWEMIIRLRAFSLINDRDKHKNIHVCGEAYSDYQGFIEGALRSAQGVLNWIGAQEYRDNIPSGEEERIELQTLSNGGFEQQSVHSINSSEQLESVKTRRESIMLQSLKKQNFNCITDYALETLNSVNLNKIESFFNNLPADPYLEGNYRFRRLSHFKLSDSGLVKLPHSFFCQSKKYNPLLGEVVREYLELDDALIELEDFQKIVWEFFDFCKLCSPSNEVGVHQIRIVASDQEIGQPVPEGIHQDGVDLVGIFCVNRERIEGGKTHLYKSKDGDPIFSKILNPGELLVFNDHQFFHFTSVIKAISSQDKAIRDVFVLTCPSLLASE